MSSSDLEGGPHNSGTFKEFDNLGKDIFFVFVPRQFWLLTDLITKLSEPSSYIAPGPCGSINLEFLNILIVPSQFH